MGKIKIPEKTRTTVLAAAQRFLSMAKLCQIAERHFVLPAEDAVLVLKTLIALIKQATTERDE